MIAVHPLPPPPPEDDLVLLPLDGTENRSVQAEAGAGRLIPGEEIRAQLTEHARRQVECDVCHGDEDAFEDCTACQGSGAFCKTCGKPWRACIEANACEPAGAPWTERRRRERAA